MSQLDYLAPASAEDAAKALAAGGDTARPLSGGTDLLVQLRAGRLKQQGLSHLDTARFRRASRPRIACC